MESIVAGLPAIDSVAIERPLIEFEFDMPGFCGVIC